MASRRRAACLVMPALSLFLTATAAQGAVTTKDMQIIGRMLGFFDPPYTGSIQVGIVYDAAGKAEAEALMSSMASGVNAGAITLQPKLVALSDAVASGVPVLLIMNTNQSSQIMQAGRKAVVISTQPGCADNGTCMVSVQSDPKVEITLNKAAAEAAGIKVSASFRMMIKER